MLEKPELDEEKLAGCLRDVYGLEAAGVEFLPVGADVNTAAYRAEAGGQAWFVKLRRGRFDEMSALLPRFLHDAGVTEIIPPRLSLGGALWAGLGDYTVVVYPFVEGRNGYEVEFTPERWRALGSAMRRVHDAPLPEALRGRIAREEFSGAWREQVRWFVRSTGYEPVHDAVARDVMVLLSEHKEAILAVVERAEGLARAVAARGPELVLCHSDLHAGNVLVTEDGRLAIVDWDSPVLAPRERDLMYPGGAQGFRGLTAAEEARFFYEGYGVVTVDQEAIEYYRAERTVQDIAVFCEELLLSDEGGADREQSYQYLASYFSG